MSKQDIQHCIRQALHKYFKDLRGADPHDLYELIMHTAEQPLLDVVMQEAQGNQSLAAQWLGINRNTLRRKLLEHGLITA